MEMNLESIRRYVNEKVSPVDFLKLLKEDGPEDDMPPVDLDAGDDLEGDDLGDLDVDLGGATTDGSATEPDRETGELGDDTESVEDRFADREDDPDFTGSSSEGSAAEGNPAGGMIYDTEGVLNGLNATISASDVNLAEIDNAKNIIEVIANGKKLIPKDFEDIHDYQSFSDIIKRTLFQTDDLTKNYFNMKIKKAIIDIQNQKKIDASKNAGEVDSMRDLASKF